MEALLKRKAIIKGQLTKYTTFINAKGQDASVDELNVRLSKTMEIYKLFVGVEDQIFAIDDSVASEMDLIDEMYFPLVSKIQSFIRKQTLFAVPQVNNEDTANVTTNANTSQYFQSDFKLRRLNLPVFDGNVKQWQSFYDIFVSTVHDNTSLSPAQKFKYLLGQLRGAAYTSLCHFRVDDANYYEAVKRLVQKYDKKKPIVETYIRDFLATPKINKATASSIMKIHDTIDETVRGLKSLGPNATNREPWILLLATDKLDEETRRIWKYESAEEDFPTIGRLLEFLSKRMDALVDIGADHVQIKSHDNNRKQITTKSYHTTVQLPSCPLCSTDHKLFDCPKFRAFSVIERRDFMSKANRCFNCLSQGHIVTNCRTTKHCQKCPRRHNTLLHFDPEPPTTVANHACSSAVKGEEKSENKPTSVNLHVREDPEDVLRYQSPLSANPKIPILPTACVEVEDKYGNWVKGRALLDSGSTHSFITESFLNLLKIPRHKSDMKICTLNSTEAGSSRGECDLKIRSHIDHKYQIPVEALIIPSITSYLPVQPKNIQPEEVTKFRPLADPTFNIPSKIDLLLGCEPFFHSLEDESKGKPRNSSFAINSKFGWIIAGNIPATLKITKPIVNSAHPIKYVEMSNTSRIEELVERFWRVEEIVPVSPLTSEERECIELFNNTTKIENNRITVCLPFKHIPPTIGESYSQAVKRFYALERRLQSDDRLRKDYHEFLENYLTLNHMEIVPCNELKKPNNSICYLPHHPVLKESSSTTKVRVVFDASAKSSSNRSLNDNLVVGPTIQDDLINILIRFRKHEYVFSADIEKMFRQISISKKDSDYHRIVWRTDPKSQLIHYRLKTVTYGTASAPFLATAALHYLADTFRDTFPRASATLKSDFYMDDLMSGADNLASALSLQRDLISLLTLGGFNIRKWSANHPQLLENIPIEGRELSSWEITDNQMITVLGIKYNPIQDYFFFKIDLSPASQFTKRSFLSEIARVYDPLGLLSPVIVGLKILFQSLWLHGILWDDELPQHILDKYLLIRNQLNQLAELKFSRWLYIADQQVELHGFADASLDAYAAVIYSRSIQNGQPKVNLLIAKTRVTPIKAISIPKLELNAATLLVRLLKIVLSSLNLLREPNIYLYSDSTITLQWLSKPPKLLKTFEANRVSEIMVTTKLSQWYFIPTEENPADLATRGLKPCDFLNNSTWINGPKFLHELQLQLTRLPIAETLTNFAKVTPSFGVMINLIAKYSNFRTMSHVLAYILRYKERLTRKSSRLQQKNLTLEEISNAEFMIYRFVQRETYSEDITCLLKGKQLPNHSKILVFHPFIDDKGVLRVGGRLQYAKVDLDTKHPILLPNNHVITERITIETHYKNLHAGQKMTNTLLKQRFAIPRAKTLIRRIIHTCLICRRFKTQQQQQLMGQLPPCRVNPSVRPFIEVGIDLAGPFSLKTFRGRGAKSFKSYIVIFVCMATKATSIEIATDLSSDTFLAALKRFCAVRGLPKHIHCDNGTNLVGAKRQLQIFYNQYLNEVQESQIQAWCSDNKINWHFIPPATPTFGGLWESTVKSCKHHLRRVIGETQLTYEEFLTMIKQIESLLNSRPLVDVQDDWDPLTPAHFMIFQPLTMIPEPNLQLLKVSHLSRWQLMQQLLQGFWKQWSQEYVTSLNKCYKWHIENRQFKIGDMILLRDQNLPPTKWAYARICDVHPGDDNVVRVVSVKLPNGNILKRPIYKLCLIPRLDSGESKAAECLNLENVA